MKHTIGSTTAYGRGLVKAVRAPWLARSAWRKRTAEGDLSLRVIEELVSDGDTVVDIGAGWGLYSWVLAGMVGTRGRVHAFEPNPLYREPLAGMRRRRRQLTVHQLGLSDRDGGGELYVPVVDGANIDPLGSLALAPAQPTLNHRKVEVPIARLDSVLDGEPVTFIKCDVEGHEFAVLRGAEAVVMASRPALLVEIEQRHQETDIHATFEHLIELGYVGFSLHPGGLRPLAEFDVERDQLAFLDEGPMPGVMPLAYIHDFLFVEPSALSGSRGAGLFPTDALG
jgi:FkbM family methyltransferase